MFSVYIVDEGEKGASVDVVSCESPAKLVTLILNV